MNRSVLITGGTGYLGSHITRELAQRGYRVTVLKRRYSRLEKLQCVIDRLQLWDVEEGLPNLFANSTFDVIIHTATLYGRGCESSMDIYAANMAFPMELLSLALKFRVDTFINTDSYFNVGGDSFSYLDSYSLTKRQFTEWGKLVSKDRSIRFANVRLEHLYGPFDAPDKFVSSIARSCLLNVDALKLTPGEQKRDFIYVADAVAGYVALINDTARLPRGFVEVGLGAGTSVSVKEFVTLLQSISGSRTQLQFGALPYRQGELMSSVADLGVLKSLGWHPVWSLEDGICELLRVERQR